MKKQMLTMASLMLLLGCRCGTSQHIYQDAKVPQDIKVENEGTISPLDFKVQDSAKIPNPDSTIKSDVGDTQIAPNDAHVTQVDTSTTIVDSGVTVPDLQSDVQVIPDVSLCQNVVCPECVCEGRPNGVGYCELKGFLGVPSEVCRQCHQPTGGCNLDLSTPTKPFKLWNQSPTTVLGQYYTNCTYGSPPKTGSHYYPDWGGDLLWFDILERGIGYNTGTLIFEAINTLANIPITLELSPTAYRIRNVSMYDGSRVQRYYMRATILSKLFRTACGDVQENDIYEVCVSIKNVPNSKRCNSFKAVRTYARTLLW